MADDNKPEDKPVDKPADKPEDKVLDKPEDKPADKPVDKPEDKPADKPAAVAADKPADEVIDKSTPDWRDKRIAVLTARLSEAKRGGGDKPADKPAADKPGTVTATQAEIDALVEQRTQERSATSEFNRLCNEAAAAGRQAFPDFDGKVTELKRLANPEDLNEMTRYNQMLVAVLETGEAPKLLHRLGGDLNEAARIMALPPIKMAVELTKMAQAEPGQISSLKKPITPVGGKGQGHEGVQPDDPERADNLSTVEWMRRREAQLEKKSA